MASTHKTPVVSAVMTAPNDSRAFQMSCSGQNRSQLRATGLHHCVSVGKLLNPSKNSFTNLKFALLALALLRYWEG